MYRKALLIIFLTFLNIRPSYAEEPVEYTVMYNDRILGNASAFTEGSSAFIDLYRLFRALGFDVQRDTGIGRVHGYASDMSQWFMLHSVRHTLFLGSEILRYDTAQVKNLDGSVYVSRDFLIQHFSLNTVVNKATSTLVAVPEKSMPALEGRIATLEKQEQEERRRAEEQRLEEERKTQEEEEKAAAEKEQVIEQDPQEKRTPLEEEPASALKEEKSPTPEDVPEPVVSEETPASPEPVQDSGTPSAPEEKELDPETETEEIPEPVAKKIPATPPVFTLQGIPLPIN